MVGVHRPSIHQVVGAHLFGAQSVGGDNLDRQVLCVNKAKGVERDLPNHGIVGYHHGHGAEQSLCAWGNSMAGEGGGDRGVGHAHYVRSHVAR